MPGCGGLGVGVGRESQPCPGGGFEHQQASRNGKCADEECGHKEGSGRAAGQGSAGAKLSWGRVSRWRMQVVERWW